MRTGTLHFLLSLSNRFFRYLSLVEALNVAVSQLHAVYADHPVASSEIHTLLCTAADLFGRRGAGSAAGTAAATRASGTETKSQQQHSERNDDENATPHENANKTMTPPQLPSCERGITESATATNADASNGSSTATVASDSTLPPTPSQPAPHAVTAATPAQPATAAATPPPCTRSWSDRVRGVIGTAPHSAPAVLQTTPLRTHRLASSVDRILLFTVCPA